MAVFVRMGTPERLSAEFAQTHAQGRFFSPLLFRKSERGISL